MVMLRWLGNLLILLALILLNKIVLGGTQMVEIILQSNGSLSGMQLSALKDFCELYGFDIKV